MRMPQKLIQRKLSSLLGAEVTMEKLNVSLLGGSLDAQGVTVTAADAKEPVLTVRRIKADVAVGRALTREIVVRSLTIERPVLTIVRDADGATNFPRRARIEASTESPDSESGDAEQKWRFDAQKVLVVDGEIRYRDERTGYHICAKRFLADLTRENDDIVFTCIADAVSRKDKPGDLGTLKLAGRLKGVNDFTRLRDAALEATLDIADRLHVQITSPALDFSWILRLLPLD